MAACVALQGTIVSIEVVVGPIGPHRPGRVPHRVDEDAPRGGRGRARAARGVAGRRRHGRDAGRCPGRASSPSRASRAGPMRHRTMSVPPRPAHGERADLAEVAERHRVGLDEARPYAVAKRRAVGAPHGPRERRRPRRRRLVRRVRAARDRRPTPPPRPRRPDRQHARRRADRRPRHRQRRSVRGPMPPGRS